MSHPIKTHRPECVISEGDHAGHKWLIAHNGMGFRCGYVHVPVGHIWHGKDYDSIQADTHGGMTYAESDTEKDGGWWAGFDCAHSGDAPDPSLPASSRMPHHAGDEIRTQEYVESECRSLCEQAEKAH